MASQYFRSGLEPAILKPFPHWEWANTLEPDTYGELANTFPLDRFRDVLDEDNQVHRLRSTNLLNDPQVAPVWRDFVLYLTSQDFWAFIVAQFGEQIRSRHPQLEERIGKPLAEWTASRPGEQPGDVVLEAQPVINTPVRSRPSRVRSSHLDNMDKIWAGLLYMRSDEDDTPGGELELQVAKSLRFDGNQIPSSKTQTARTIPYEANRFAAFVNAPDAIHSVGLRPVTPHVRRYLNLYAKLPRGKVFEAPQMNLFSRAANRLAGLGGARRR